MKMNNKGYASTIIMFSVLALFLVSMLMLIQTMNNSKSLNKNITDKVTDNIDYSASGSLQTEIDLLKQQMSNLVDKMYPVGSIYMTTTYSDATQVHDAIGGEWEKYAQGRTIIGEGTVTDLNGETKLYSINDNSKEGGVLSVKLDTSNLPSHSHSIPSLTGNTSTNGSHTHSLNNAERVFRWNGGVSGNIVPTGGSDTPMWGGYVITVNSSGDHSHTITTNSSITGLTGDNKSFNIENPYVVTYMYKRVS